MKTAPKWTSVKDRRARTKAGDTRTLYASPATHPGELRVRRLVPAAAAPIDARKKPAKKAQQRVTYVKWRGEVVVLARRLTRRMPVAVISTTLLTKDHPTEYKSTPGL